MIIYIYSASGVGSSTIGKIIAQELHYRYVDIDDILFHKSDIPYTKRRSASERVKLFQAELIDNTVISGWFSDGIGDFMNSFDKVIFLTLNQAERIRRIKMRELEKHGKRILPGGDMYENFNRFLEWSRGYDDFDITKRSYKLHKHFYDKLTCEKIMLDNTDIYKTVEKVNAFLNIKVNSYENRSC